MNISALICKPGVSCLLPVESLLAAEVREAGVPQSCRKTLLFCSSQVRKGRTSLIVVIRLINIYSSIEGGGGHHLLNLKPLLCRARPELPVSLKGAGKAFRYFFGMKLSRLQTSQGPERWWEPLGRCMGFRLHGTLQTYRRSGWMFSHRDYIGPLNCKILPERSMILYWSQKKFSGDIFLSKCSLCSITFQNSKSWMCTNMCNM